MINNAKKRVVIIGSSMSMPRLEIAYEETWIYKAICDYPEILFIDKSRRASTSDRFLNDGEGQNDPRRGADIMDYYSPHVIITQVGITDCAPRLFNKNKLSTKIINHLPFKKIKSLIYKYKKKYSGRKLENAYVSIDRFESNWRTFIQRAEKLNSFILCVAISEPTKLVLSKSPLIKNAIIDYNNILYKLEKEYNNLFVIQPMTLDQSEKVSIDEFHVNSDGHQIIYNNLKPFLERCLL